MLTKKHKDVLKLFHTQTLIKKHNLLFEKQKKKDYQHRTLDNFKITRTDKKRLYDKTITLSELIGCRIII